MITSLLDFTFTLYVWLPLGILRSAIEGVLEPLLRFFTNAPHRPVLPAPPRVVVISGASSGIGANLVQAYACPQTALVILGRDENRLSQVAKVAKSLGCVSLETHSIDYAHEDAESAIRKVIVDTRQKYGVIDEIFAVTGTVTFTNEHPCVQEDNKNLSDNFSFNLFHVQYKSFLGSAGWMDRSQG